MASPERPGEETTEIDKKGGATENLEQVVDKITKTAYTSSEPVHPMDNHLSGRYLPENATTNMKRSGESGQLKHAPSGMEYESENWYT